jgi:hypothetical protein
MARGLFFVFMACLAASARAQTDKTVVASADGRQEVSIELGAFRPTARFGLNGVTGDKGERFGGTGFLFVFDYLHALTPFLSAGLEGLYINRGTYELKNLAFSAQFPGTSTQVHGHTKALLATIRLRRSGTGIRPYLLGGIGGHATHMDVFMQARPGFIWGAGFGQEINVVQSDASGLIGVLRAGIERAFPDGGSVGIEAGWVGIPAQRYSRTEIGRIFLPNDVVSRGDGLTIAAKFGYRFGGGY